MSLDSPKDFFRFLYPRFSSSPSVIEIRGIQKSPKRIKRFFCSTIDDIEEAIRSLTELNSYDIYFECPELKPKSKKGTEEHVLGYPFLYADLDPAIKDRKGNVIKSFTRRELLESIDRFPLKPSLVVDSGNGFHVYWRLEKPINSVAEAKPILRTLSEALQGGDVKGGLATQLLRIPGTINHKDGALKSVYVYFANDLKYRREDFLKHLTIQRQHNRNKRKPIKLIPSSDHSVAFTFDERPTPLDLEMDDLSEVISHLQQQNPFLATNQPDHALSVNFSCLFHSDENPSANIYRTKHGKYFYKCFAASDGTSECHAEHLDLIQICQSVKGFSFLQAVMYLCDFFGIRFVRRKWFWKQLEKYQQNAFFIESFEELGYQNSIPHLYKKIRSKLVYLKLINHYALGKLSSEKYQYEGEAVFFFSYDYLASLQRVSEQAIRNNVNTFCMFGLLRKLDIKDVPPDLMRKAREYQQEMSELRGRKMKPVNFYTLPLLSDCLLDAERKARELHFFNMRNCMNKSFLIEQFGENEANEVYHDERTLSKRDQAIRRRLERTLCQLIKHQGYATKRQVLAKTKIEGRLRVTPSEKEQVLDRNLNNFLDGYNLISVRANKALRQQFGLARPIQIIIPAEAKD